jgi:hypothetical protein
MQPLSCDFREDRLEIEITEDAVGVVAESFDVDPSACKGIQTLQSQRHLRGCLFPNDFNLHSHEGILVLEIPYS